ncbi:hypothetical protein DFH28DRAFT_926098 [Melampsora americana]|nr:hypothetical protein DFH28DRAFT_926098 [Melampsora americana]
MNISIIGLLFQVSMLAARPKLTGPSANLGAAYLCEQQGLNKDIHSMGNINTNIFGTQNNYEVIGTTKRLKLKVQKGAKKFQCKIKSSQSLMSQPCSSDFVHDED